MTTSVHMRHRYTRIQTRGILMTRRNDLPVILMPNQLDYALLSYKNVT